MIRKIFICSILCILSFFCFAEDYSSSVPEEIGDSDFSLIQESTGYTYRLFGNIYDAKTYLGDFDPVLIYEHPDDYYSQLAQKWSHIYIEWVRGTGIILTISVEEIGFRTKRGIGIGDTIKNIDEAYGKDTGYRNEYEIEFDLGSEEYETMMGLRFYLVDEIVVKIEILQGN
jgi:hypothetical protein